MRVLRLWVGLALVASLSFVASCGQGTGSPALDVHVDWGLTDPTVDIPAGIERLRLLVWTNEFAPAGLRGTSRTCGDDSLDDAAGEECDDGNRDNADGCDSLCRIEPSESFHTVAGLDDRDGDGNRELCPQSVDNDCTSGGLPPGAPIRITVEGLSAAGATTHVGHAGPFVLQHGERRYVDLRMYATNAIGSLPEAPATARFLHTATALADGRVLIAGGFDRVTTTACPATLPAGSHCFALTASDDAFLFDPPSGRVRAVSGGMLRARGAHTATVLPDGNVLVAGGSETATLTLVPQTSGMALDLIPGTGGDTYEIFAPGANAEVVDTDGDGDPGRGGFLGAAEDPAIAGRLGEPRVLHAATLLPGVPGRVLLAGGRSAPGTFSVFDLDRAGGYGIVGAGALGTARSAPSAATFGTGTTERAWIFGGATARSNFDLAEAWRAGTGSDRVGSTMVPMGFPDPVGTERPGFSLARPNVEVLSSGAHALVLGWFGPLCEPATTTPSYAPTATELCNFGSATMGSRSFTVASATGLATETPTRNGHAFGATARLDDGRIVVTGGFDGLALTARNTADLFTGDVAAGVASLSEVRPPMGSPRALHTTTPLMDHGYLTFGGIAPSADGASVALVPGIEVVYLR